jgi:hypothetical protein
MHMTECSSHQSKICTKCKESKDLEAFTKNKRYKSGYHSQCKSCTYSLRKSQVSANPDQYRESRKKHYQANIEKMRAEKRKYIAKSKPQKIAYDAEYRKANKDKIAAYKKEWASKMKNDPIYKIKKNLRRRVHHALMGENKSAATFELIGCSPEDFKKHIESLWLEGMSWDNYGPSGWHVDHIKECHTFDLSDSKQQQECFHYSNQRPLWAKDNLSRSRPSHNRNIRKTHQSHQEECS